MSTSKPRPWKEDTLTRSRRVLGEDHPDPLHAANNNLTIRLGALGKHEQAQALVFGVDTAGYPRHLVAVDPALSLPSIISRGMPKHSLTRASTS